MTPRDRAAVDVHALGIEADDLALLDSANRLTLTDSADRFAAVAAEIMTADARAAAERGTQRETLLSTPMAPSQAAE